MTIIIKNKPALHTNETVTASKGQIPVHTKNKTNIYLYKLKQKKQEKNKQAISYDTIYSKLRIIQTK